MEAPKKSFQSKEFDFALGVTADFQGGVVGNDLYIDDNIAAQKKVSPSLLTDRR